MEWPVVYEKRLDWLFGVAGIWIVTGEIIQGDVAKNEFEG